MNEFLKTLTFLCFLWLFSGCSHKSSLPNKEFQDQLDGYYVPVLLLIDDGTNGSTRAFPYDKHIYQRFSESRLFQHIGSNPDLWDHEVLVEFDQKNNGGMLNTLGLMLSAATLLIVPMPTDITYTMRVTVLNGDKVKHYSYVDRKEDMTSVLDLNGSASYQAIDNLLNHFFADLQRDQFLPMIERR